MAMPVHCPRCDTENPDNGHFCIECGAALRQASTGSTERLVEAENGTRCGSCGTMNPAHASFCVNCGRSLEADPAGARPAVAVPAAPVTSLPPMPAPLVSVPAPHGAAARAPRFNPAVLGSMTGGLFLIGLAILFITGWFWPGILVLIGLTAAMGSLAGGQPRSGLIALCWLWGLAILFETGWIWPGILVLVGLTAILGPLLGTSRRHP